MASEDMSFGELLIRGAREALSHKRGEDVGAHVTTRKLTARSVEVTPPPEYDQHRVRELRDRLGVSQAVLADLLSVSPASVRAWEQGLREPSAPVRRLMQILEREPEVLEDDVRVVPERTE